MSKSKKITERELKRLRLFGIVFVIIGICFIMYGGINLIGIYNRESHMFAIEEGLTPEKGMMWSQFLSGMSVCLIGILMGIKAGIDLRKEKKAE